ncbi:MAG: hypothetical protein ACR2FX_06440 [Chthoniobacterales bacterium]
MKDPVDASGRVRDGIPVATPSGSKRTEIRGDGKKRDFIYSGVFVQSVQDFNGVAAIQGYDTKGFLNSFKGPQGQPN